MYIMEAKLRYLRTLNPCFHQKPIKSETSPQSILSSRHFGSASWIDCRGILRCVVTFSSRTLGLGFGFWSNGLVSGLMRCFRGVAIVSFLAQKFECFGLFRELHSGTVLSDFVTRTRSSSKMGGMVFCCGFVSCLLISVLHGWAGITNICESLADTIYKFFEARSG